MLTSSEQGRALRGTSLRHHPELTELFREHEGAIWPESALAAYALAVPEHAARADAAREVFRARGKAVQATVEHIFSVYPFDKIDYSKDKCPRDVGVVADYAAHAMLCNDHDWHRDRFLLWLRTILQAFFFPSRSEGSPVLLASGVDRIASMPQQVQSLYETYTTLLSHFRSELSPGAYRLYAPFLQQSIDTITAT